MRSEINLSRTKKKDNFNVKKLTSKDLELSLMVALSCKCGL